MLAKALAHHFDAKLLLLDITDFSLKVNVWERHCFLMHIAFPVLYYYYYHYYLKSGSIFADAEQVWYCKKRTGT